jgi:hypothetical protein
VAEADVGEEAVQWLGQPPRPLAEQAQKHRHQVGITRRNPAGGKYAGKFNDPVWSWCSS